MTAYGFICKSKKEEGPTLREKGKASVQNTHLRPCFLRVSKVSTVTSIRQVVAILVTVIVFELSHHVCISKLPTVTGMSVPSPKKDEPHYKKKGKKVSYTYKKLRHCDMDFGEGNIGEGIYWVSSGGDHK